MCRKRGAAHEWSSGGGRFANLRFWWHRCGISTRAQPHSCGRPSDEGIRSGSLAASAARSRPRHLPRWHADLPISVQSRQHRRFSLLTEMRGDRPRRTRSALAGFLNPGSGVRFTPRGHHPFDQTPPVKGRRSWSRRRSCRSARPPPSRAASSVAGRRGACGGVAGTGPARFGQFARRYGSHRARRPASVPSVFQAARAALTSASSAVSAGRTAHASCSRLR